MSVIVYSTPTCPYCHMAKQFLDGKGIEYQDIDVSADSSKAQEMIDKSGQMGVPVIDVDGEILVGFDKAALEAALGGAGAKEESGEEATEAPTTEVSESPSEEPAEAPAEEPEGVVESQAEEAESRETGSGEGK